MNYQQLVTPNLDPVVYQYGSYLTDWYGWCLAVAWAAFNGHITNPTAWSAWTNSVQYKHEDSNVPSGVYVPIWFSGYSGAGHVAIYKDGQVWSSPYTHKVTMDVLSSIAQVEKTYGVTYVGWSEDIGGVRVVEPITQGDEDMIDDAGARALFTISTLLAQDGAAPDRQPTLDEIKNLIGKPYLQGMQELMQTDPWKHNYAKVKYYDSDVANAASSGLNKSSVEGYIAKHLS